MRCLLALMLSTFLGSHVGACAGEEKVGLKPSVFKLDADAKLSDVLASISKQTGNKVVDARAGDPDKKINERFEKATFWQALESICRETGARLSPFHTPGAIALTRGADRQAVADDDGIFRLSVQRVSLVDDVEEGNRVCHLNLLLMWEPRYRPFYMEAGRFEGIYAGKNEKTMAVKMPGQGKQELTGSRATMIPVRFPAPPRHDFDRIETLKGSIKVVLPTAMSTFRFDKLAVLGKKDEPRKLEQDGVTVTLDQVSVGPDRWSFLLRIDNAPGVPAFESYQSWLGYNRIVLEKDGGKTVWAPRADDMEILQETAQRALVRHHFTESKFLRSKVGDWTLSYTTPRRIVAAEASFELKDIDLP